MAKDAKARRNGYLTLNALGVIMGSAVDAMKAADVPNDVVHHFLDQLEGGFVECLWGKPQLVMLTLVDVLRKNVASND